MRILIHTCCGPCLIVPFFELLGGGDITAFYYNPNIHPSQEYTKRLKTFEEFCQEEDINYIVADYNPRDYFDKVRFHLPEGERCLDCYRLRLKVTAKQAAEDDYEAITTTLLVSPYQNFEKIMEIGRNVAHENNLKFVGQDFRQNYRHSVEESRNRGMYRQGYCGCLFSEMERYYRP